MNVRIASLGILSAALAAALALPVVAQPQDKAEAASPVFSPKKDDSTTKSAPKRTRAISSGVASQLAAAMPKYAPPAPAKEPEPAREMVDMREVDKPRNTIIRLPDYVVKEPTPPVFTERAIMTDKGLADIAVRRYMSEADRALNRFTLPLFGTSMESRALAMYAEEERLQNMAAIEDAAQTVSVSDAASGAYIRREGQKTYLRSSQFGYRSSNSE